MKKSKCWMLCLNTVGQLKATKGVIISFLNILPYVLSFLFLACSKDEESRIEISYDFQVLEIVFQSVGESTAPTVEWNGEVGTFSLKNPTDGISVDPNSGVLTW